MFHVGQKVICVRQRDPKSYGYGDEIHPEKGNIYTVRASFLGFIGKPVCWLEEIQNSPRRYRGGSAEFAFCQTRFRPVRKTDISVFTNMLNTQPLTQKVGG